MVPVALKTTPPVTVDYLPFFRMFLPWFSGEHSPTTSCYMLFEWMLLILRFTKIRWCCILTHLSYWKWCYFPPISTYIFPRSNWWGTKGIDVRRALLFCQARPQPFCKGTHLFVFYSDLQKVNKSPLKGCLSGSYPAFPSATNFIQVCDCTDDHLEIISYSYFSSAVSLAWEIEWVGSKCSQKTGGDG